MWILSGSHDIIGSLWWLHLLNVEDAYRDSSQAFILSTLSSVGENGSLSGMAGGGPRFLQPPGQDSTSALSTSIGFSSVPAAAMLGKSAGMIPSAFITAFDM